MAIQIRLDVLLKRNNLTSKQLSKLIGITEANLSILKSGKAKAIRFSTLSAICRELNCQPGEIVYYVSESYDNP
ncbi:helix-turn-helix transcriptional regulator [Salmonella enterica]|nr:helix-turn-helix transcriptional regulator [Salmonella enterica subsp. enterica serovar Edinburgh]EBH8904525.1 transcriptional regulator [Salmonella enterica subsp. enterica serovar 6,7:b:-]EBH8909367.1 transcriptional regulator [Salmonella enterica subsp. enterica serovar Santiago]EHG2694887.1 helix-turn-helix transcriptional regulator [Salmonella enterica]EBH8946148.1 transcriptional regulator [Salmonella enterica subsp. enterica serovar 6,7:b:-]